MCTKGLRADFLRARPQEQEASRSHKFASIRSAPVTLCACAGSFAALKVEHLCYSPIIVPEQAVSKKSAEAIALFCSIVHARVQTFQQRWCTTACNNTAICGYWNIVRTASSQQPGARAGVCKSPTASDTRAEPPCSARCARTSCKNAACTMPASLTACGRGLCEPAALQPPDP